MERIDVHHHILPPKYVEAWNAASTIPKGLRLPAWSPNLSLEFMDRNGIGTTILSLSAPALSIVKDKAEAAALCREINEYAKSLRDQHPGRFGFFATLPSLEDVPACLDELNYAFDTLQADGVTLLTSYGGRYLGDPHFASLWKELDRRSAVVFVHPTLENLGGAIENPYLPRPIIDFPHETTRTAVHLIISNTVRDNPNCKIILSHAGGTLPYLATRVAYQSADVKLIEKSAEDFLEEAQSFYFDLALSGYPHIVDMVVKFAKPGHVLYGSDYPFAREVTASRQVSLLNESDLPDDVDRAIRRDTALKLFPRFASAS